ncbi:hypothetical protein GCK32_009518, partial [Trichostrongylus colubriformis]
RGTTSTSEEDPVMLLVQVSGMGSRNGW